MNSRLLAIGVLVLGCMVAAGVGAYLAVRQGGVPPALASVAAEPSQQNNLAAKAPEDARWSTPGPVASAETRVTPGTTPIEAPKAARRPQATASATGRGPQPNITSRAAENSTAQPAVQPPAAGQVAEQVPPVEVAPPVQVAPEPSQVPQMPPPVEPEVPDTVELVVPADAVIGLRVDTGVSSESARVEDPVSARVTRDVRVGSELAIPAGARVQGSVVTVLRGGRFKERARLGVRFHTLELPDGTRLSLLTEPVFREGESPTGDSAAKVSAGAVGGAIIGAIIGGGRGAVIGSATGAGAGTAAVMAGGRSEATLPAGSSVTVRLTRPVTVTLDR